MNYLSIRRYFTSFGAKTLYLLGLGKKKVFQNRITTFSAGLLNKYNMWFPGLITGPCSLSWAVSLWALVPFPGPLLRRQCDGRSCDHLSTSAPQATALASFLWGTGMTAGQAETTLQPTRGHAAESWWLRCEAGPQICVTDTVTLKSILRSLSVGRRESLPLRAAVLPDAPTWLLP